MYLIQLWSGKGVKCFITQNQHYHTFCKRASFFFGRALRAGICHGASLCVAFEVSLSEIEHNGWVTLCYRMRKFHLNSLFFLRWIVVNFWEIRSIQHVSNQKRDQGRTFAVWGNLPQLPWFLIYLDCFDCCDFDFFFLCNWHLARRDLSKKIAWKSK